MWGQLAILPRTSAAFHLAAPLRVCVPSLSWQMRVDRRPFACAQVQVDRSSTRPKFPGPISVSSIPPVPAAELDAFRQQHLSNEKLAYGTPEAIARCADVRGLQYTRWQWATENIETYVNMLRAAGHSENRIQDMFEGIPMCFPSPAAYAELRSALRVLAADVEVEMGWRSVGFVITGSSVPGFSQNPLKGFAEKPSKITKSATSDVDICIIGEGVEVTMKSQLKRGAFEPSKRFETTCSPNSSGVRFGCQDMSVVCKAADKFHAVWSAKLPGGLQFTFSEASNLTPPWEAFINIEQL